jgi:hypothetical protein
VFAKRSVARLHGARIVLHSKTPELVRQELYGLLLAHFAIRALMHEAALKGVRTRTASPSCTRCASCAAGSPPGTIFPPRQRTAFHERVLDEILEERVARSRGRRHPRGVKRKMGNSPLRRRGAAPLPRAQVNAVVVIVS